MTLEHLLTVMPLPDNVTFHDLQPGLVPYALLTYELGKQDDVLEAALGEAFQQARAQSKDGTVKVRVG
jgi:hypothetical protein